MIWNTSLHFLRICRHRYIYSFVLTWICNKQLTSNVRYKFCKIYEYSKCLVDTLEKICRMLNNVENVWPVFLLLKLYLLRKNSLTVSFKQENVSESIFCFNDPMVTFTLYWYLKKLSKWSKVNGQNIRHRQFNSFERCVHYICFHVYLLLSVYLSSFAHKSYY